MKMSRPICGNTAPYSTFGHKPMLGAALQVDLAPGSPRSQFLCSLSGDHHPKGDDVCFVVRCLKKSDKLRCNIFSPTVYGFRHTTPIITQIHITIYMTMIHHDFAAFLPAIPLSFGSARLRRSSGSDSSVMSAARPSRKRLLQTVRGELKSSMMILRANQSQMLHVSG